MGLSEADSSQFTPGDRSESSFCCVWYTQMMNSDQHSNEQSMSQTCRWT